MVAQVVHCTRASTKEEWDRNLAYALLPNHTPYQKDGESFLNSNKVPVCPRTHAAPLKKDAFFYFAKVPHGPAEALAHIHLG